MIGLLISLLATTPAPALAVDPRFIASPQWVRRPTAKDFIEFYPTRTDQRFEARAMLVCAVTSAGTLTRCTASVSPAAATDFARSALALAPYFAMAPRAPDGRSVAGRWVRIPIVFRQAAD
jgi:TonB family protein